MKEAEIRPPALLDEQRRLYAADVARLLERRSEFVEARCPACGADTANILFVKYEMRFVLCTACETTYISPRPTPELLKSYYETSENYKFWAEKIFPASEEARREKIFRPRALRIWAYLGSRGPRHPIQSVIVDVGAGFGTFCQELEVLNQQFNTCHITAVEPTPALAAICRSRGINTIEQRIEDVSTLGADVVTAWEVIEHSFSPLDFLAACHHTLNPNGLLFLTCPNGLGFDVSELHQQSTTFDAEHLNYFNPASMRTLLERAGFQVVSITTPGELDAELVHNAVLEGRHVVDPFLQRILIDEWETLGAPFQRFLAENGLSSHMWVVAQKP